MATEIEQLQVSLSADLKKYESALAKASGVTTAQLRKMERSMQASATRMEKTLGGIGSSLKGGIAVGVAAAVASFTAFAKAAISDAAALGDLSDKIGINTDLLQGLQLGAVQANMSFEELNTGLLKFSKNIGEAANGEGDLFKILQANNVAINDAAGKQRPLNDLLNDFADLVKNAKNEQQALLLIVAGMGKGGEKFLEFLRKGSSGLKTFQSDLQDSGGGIDQNMIKKAQELDDKWAEVMSTMKTNTQIFILDAVAGFEGMVKSAKGAFTDIQDAYEFTRKVLSGESTNGTKVEPDGFGGFNIVDDRGSNNPLAPSGTASGPGKGSITNSQGAVQKVTKGITDNTEVLKDQKKKSDAIKRLIDFSIEQQHRAADAAKEATDKQLELDQQLYNSKMALADITLSAFDAIVIGGEKAEDVLKNLVKQLASAALKASLLGEGPLAGLFGSGQTGGFLGSLFKLPGRASGGPVSAGRPYIVGETRPELFVPSQSGNIVPRIPRGGAGGYSKIEIHNHGSVVQTRVASDGIDQRKLIILVDQRIAQQTADPYSKSSAALSARGARPPVKQR